MYFKTFMLQSKINLVYLYVLCIMIMLLSMLALTLAFVVSLMISFTKLHAHIRPLKIVLLKGRRRWRCSYINVSHASPTLILVWQYFYSNIPNQSYTPFSPQWLVSIGWSPFSTLFPSKTPFPLIRVFGYVCYVHVSQLSSNKLNPQAIQCVFIGYALKRDIGALIWSNVALCQF